MELDATFQIVKCEMKVEYRMQNKIIVPRKNLVDIWRGTRELFTLIIWRVFKISHKNAQKHIPLKVNGFLLNENSYFQSGYYFFA